MEKEVPIYEYYKSTKNKYDCLLISLRNQQRGLQNSRHFKTNNT